MQTFDVYIQNTMLGTDDVRRKHYALVNELQNASKVNSGHGVYKFELFVDLPAFQAAVTKNAATNHKCLCVQSELRHCRDVLALTWRTHAADLRCLTFIARSGWYLREQFALGVASNEVAMVITTTGSAA